MQIPKFVCNGLSYESSRNLDKSVKYLVATQITFDMFCAINSQKQEVNILEIQNHCKGYYYTLVVSFSQWVNIVHSLSISFMEISLPLASVY